MASPQVLPLVYNFGSITYRAGGNISWAEGIFWGQLTIYPFVMHGCFAVQRSMGAAIISILMTIPPESHKQQSSKVSTIGGNSKRI